MTIPKPTGFARGKTVTVQARRRQGVTVIAQPGRRPDAGSKGADPVQPDVTPKPRPPVPAMAVPGEDQDA